MIAGCTRRFRRYSPIFCQGLVPLLLQFPTTKIPLWIIAYTCRSCFYSQSILLLQDTPKFSLLIQEYLVPTALQFFATWIPLQINTHTCRVSAHPQLFMCFTKVFEIPFDLLKILSNLLLWNFLFAFIMINPISLVILLASIVIIFWVRWFNMLWMLAILNQILEFILPAQTPFLNMSWVSTNQVAVDCNPLCLFGYPSMIRASASDPSFWKS